MAHTPAATNDNDRPGLLSRIRMRSRPLLWRMMAQQGIDPLGRWWHGAEHMTARAVSRCLACPSTDKCVSWLAAAAPGERPPEFCPNGRALEACHIMAPDAVPGERSTEPQPSVPEILSDPLVERMMAADRVNKDNLQQAIENALRLAAGSAKA